MRNYGTACRVMVTGGAGFLGSHRCEHLLGRGDDVTFPLYMEADEICNLACPACPACPVHCQQV